MPSKIPVPNHYKCYIEDIESHHHGAFPEMQTAIRKEHHAEAHSDNEETNISHKALPCDVEGSHQSHGSCDHSCNESRSTNELTNCKTAAVSFHCCEGREDVRTTISKSQECNSRHAFTHTQNVRDSTEVYTEEVARGNADRAEK